MPAEPVRLHRAIQAELRVLVAHGLLSEADWKRVSERYPVTPWDVARLVRWFTLLGAVTAGLGFLLLVGEHCYQYVLQALRFVWARCNPYLVLEGLFALLAAGLFWGGFHLGRRRGLVAAGAAVELLGCFAATALTFTLGAHFSTGSGNWPALLGIDMVPFFAAAYALRNRLILIYAAINLFVFFGGETGYVSGWGMYWLGMNYPLRFLLAGAVSVGVGLLHSHGGVAALRPYASFSRVYGHFGFLLVNLALWFFALFGYFNGHVTWSDNAGERLFFSLAWGLVSAGSLYLGLTRDMSIPRAYGLVFLLINVYTFYFQFVVAHTAVMWWLHLLLVGGSLLVLGFRLERGKSLLRGEQTHPGADPSGSGPI